MKIVKALFFGTVGGFLYAFVSFRLVTPYFVGNWEAVAFFAIQGFLFAGFFMLLSTVFLRTKTKAVLVYAVIGGISGLLSSGYNVFATYYNTIMSTRTAGTMVPPAMRYAIFKQLAYYSLGSLILGAFVGLLIGYKNRVDNRGN